MIKVNNLNINYDSNNVLNNLSLNISKGKITTIVGPNGCGKSTLIKAFLGLFKYSTKQIIIDDIIRANYPRNIFAKKVAFLMQFNDVPNGMKVIDLVSFGRYPYKKRFSSYSNIDHFHINWALEKTNLVSMKDKFVSELSGGEKQRAFIALALAQKTEVIILDEPTNHLDLKFQYEILNLIRRLNVEENLTFVCVMHDLNLALRYSDEIVVMNEGKVIICGKPEVTLTRSVIKEVFGVDCYLDRVNGFLNISII